MRRGKLKKQFILLFDIPKDADTEKRRINRELHRRNMEMLQNSVWRGNDLKALLRIAKRIKKAGGKARILEEKLIFE